MAIGNIPAYNAEYTPATLRAVGQAVVDHFPEIEWRHIGFKGDDNHDGGYHRSIRWNYTTLGYGANYSDRISRDTSERATVRKDAIRAIDITAPKHVLLPMCQRLDRAVRAGLLEHDVREWYGNVNGDRIVDGYDNFRNAVASSDPSHLLHLHVSLYTDTVDQSHTTLTGVLIGTNVNGDDLFMALTPAEETEVLENTRWVKQFIDKGERRGGSWTGPPNSQELAWMARQFTEIDGANTALRNQLALAMSMVQQLIDMVNEGGGDMNTATILAHMDEIAAEQQAAMEARWEREADAKRAALALEDPDGNQP